MQFVDRPHFQAEVRALIPAPVGGVSFRWWSTNLLLAALACLFENPKKDMPMNHGAIIPFDFKISIVHVSARGCVTVCIKKGVLSPS